MNDDLIRRQDAIDRINKQREHLQPDLYPQDALGDCAYRICAEFIERLPSAQPTIDAVEVVRCRDCKWWDVDSDCIFCEYGRVPKDDWFCADGEVKEDV